VYRLVPDRAVIDQAAVLPVAALPAYLEVLSVLELTPWNGEPQNRDNPDGAVRRFVFGPGGAGQVIYLVLDEPPEVHLLMLQWLG
jgi:hypothetical protein